MSQHLNRTAWVGILAGLAGLTLLYLGVTEYLRQPAFESAVTVGLALLCLLQAKQYLIGGSSKAKEWTRTAILALVFPLLVLGTVQGARPFSMVAWIILGATIGVIVLVAAVAGVIRSRRNEANPRLQRTRSARR